MQTMNMLEFIYDYITTYYGKIHLSHVHLCISNYKQKCQVRFMHNLFHYISRGTKRFSLGTLFIIYNKENN